MSASTLLRSVFGLVLCTIVCGCHDGPLYQLKHMNPYFTMREWAQDKELGVTDHERMAEMRSLSKKISKMPPDKQTFWRGELERIMREDASPEMRRLVVVTAGGLSDPGALELIERGLDDSSIKVQMEACRVLGRRPEPRAAQLLASTVGTTADLDVKNSAIEAIGNHPGKIATDSLRVVLNDQNPATIDLAINSLRGVTGEDHGNDPQQWIAALDGATSAQPTGVPGDSGEVQIAEGPPEGLLR